MLIDEFQLVLSVVQNLQFPGSGNGARVRLEDAGHLVGSCREAHSSEDILLVSDITVWHSRFLSFVHMADLHAAFRSAHRRKRSEFRLEEGVAVQVARLYRWRLAHALQSLLRDCEGHSVGHGTLWHRSLMLENPVGAFFRKNVLRILIVKFINCNLINPFNSWTLCFGPRRVDRRGCTAQF